MENVPFKQENIGGKKERYFNFKIYLKYKINVHFAQCDVLYPSRHSSFQDSYTFEGFKRHKSNQLIFPPNELFLQQLRN